MNKKIVWTRRNYYTCPSTFEDELGGGVFVLEEEADEAEETAEESVGKEEV